MHTGTRQFQRRLAITAWLPGSTLLSQREFSDAIMGHLEAMGHGGPERPDTRVAKNRINLVEPNSLYWCGSGSKDITRQREVHRQNRRQYMLSKDGASKQRWLALLLGQCVLCPLLHLMLPVGSLKLSGFSYSQKRISNLQMKSFLEEDVIISQISDPKVRIVHRSMISIF